MFLNWIEKKISITWKLILTTSLPFLILFVTLTIFVPYQMDQISLQSAEESLKMAINDVAVNFYNQMAITEPQRLNIQVVVYDNNFIPIRYYNYSYEVYPPEDIEKLAIRETPIRDYQSHLPPEDPFFEVAEYTQEIEINETKYYFQATKNIHYKSEIVHYSQLIAFTLFFAAIVLVFITSWFSVKRNLRSLKKIAQTAESITINNLSSSIPVQNTKDEIGQMVQAFNRMIERLNESVARQNRFLSDVSHEIKTPIAIIKGYVNMIHRWGYKDPEIFNEAVTAIDSSVNDITDIINNLLLIDNLQNQSLSQEFKKTDMGALIDKIAQATQSLHPKRKISVTKTKRTTATCCEKLIAQVVRILVDNSLKYSPPDSPLEFYCSVNSKSCRIEVKDYGGGIAESEIPKVFDRFYRVDKSRSKETGGSGLGLSIASEIMKIHQGTISLSNKKPCCLSAVINFPTHLST